VAATPSPPRSRLFGIAVVLIGLAVIGFGLWPLVAARPKPPPPPVPAWPYPFKVGRHSANEREIAFYQKRVKERPTSGIDHASLASAYLRQARLTMDPAWYLLAEKSARESLAHQPVANAAALLILARVCEARHDFAESLDLVSRVRPPSDDTLAIEVTSHLARGDMTEAAAAARKLVETAPTPGNYGLLALTRIATGDDDGAAEAFRRALSREEPEDFYASAWLRVMLGRFSFRRGRRALARDLYSEALRIMPDYPLALAQLAELEAASGELAAADADYERAFTAARLPLCLIARARIQVQLGNPGQADDLRGQALRMLEQQLQGGAFGHRRDLARLLLDRAGPGDVKRAVGLMTEETRLRRDPETMDVLAAALLADGQAEKALEAERGALRCGLRDAGMSWRLGQIERRLGHEEAARRAEAESRSIDPAWKP
jgi:tetratricopeptide (TPR) repeat protein